MLPAACSPTHRGTLHRRPGSPLHQDTSRCVKPYTFRRADTKYALISLFSFDGFNPKAMLVIHLPDLFMFLTPHTSPCHPLKLTGLWLVPSPRCERGGFCWGMPQAGLSLSGSCKWASPEVLVETAKRVACACYWMLLLLRQTRASAGGLREEPRASGPAGPRSEEELLRKEPRTRVPHLQPPALASWRPATCSLQENAKTSSL